MPRTKPQNYLGRRTEADDSRYADGAAALRLQPDAGEELWLWSSARNAPPDVLAGECGFCVVSAGRVVRILDRMAVH